MRTTRVQGSTIALGAVALGVLAYAAMTGNASAAAPELPPPPPPPTPPKKQLALPATIPSHPVEVTNAPSTRAQDMLGPDWDKPLPLPAAAPKFAKKPAPAAAPASPSAAATAARLAALPSPLGPIDVNRPTFEPPLAAAPASPQGRTAREAARALLNYVSPLARAGNADALGTKDHPSDEVAKLQMEMKLVKSDGIYGPKTAARGKELLGIEFPARNSGKRRVAATPPHVDAIDLIMKPAPVPPPPSTKVATHSPLEAASALLALVTHAPVNWGSKASPNKLIAAAQKDMGGLTADGVYGPLTASRGAKLLSKPFPARGK
jgi:hypothetical protein